MISAAPSTIFSTFSGDKSEVMRVSIMEIAESISIGAFAISASTRVKIRSTARGKSTGRSMIAESTTLWNRTVNAEMNDSAFWLILEASC